jgi:hypothetical protein
VSRDARGRAGPPRRSRYGSVAAIASLACLTAAIVRYVVWDLETVPAHAGGLAGAVLARAGPLLCLCAAVLFAGALWLWLSDPHGD